FGHPSVEFVSKHFSNTSQHLEETTEAPIETYRKERINLLSHGTEIRHCWKAPIDQLNLRELYEQDECFAEFNNLISITRNKKNPAISS
ncbi:hypothetical protein Goklo_024618, partial [Gossypium klotzschianum]|nr:hypothetical protein [Gossypium klotzschianum]